MRRAYRFRLYPNADQRRELGILLETHRRLYNACLDQRKTAWEAEKRSVRYPDQSAWYKSMRAVNPWFARVNFSSSQATMRRLEKAFAAFYRRCNAGEDPGYPHFKPAHRFGSVEYPAYGDGIRLLGNRLRVQHVGRIKVKAHRPVEGGIKTATLRRDAGKWAVVLNCDLPDVPFVPNGKPPIGIDVGLERFLTTSDGQVVENPRFLQHELPRLRRLQRAVSRKKRGGKNRKKAIRLVQSLHLRVRNLRHDFHHKVALDLVPEAKAGDTVLVHAGVALSLVRDADEARGARED